MLRRLGIIPEMERMMKKYIGKTVLVFCMNYIYTGVVKSVTKNEAVLSRGAIVYETGSFDSAKFGDAQLLGDELVIRLSSMESYHETKKRI